MLFLVFGLMFFHVALVNGNTLPDVEFIENKNQWPADVHFLAKVNGVTMTVGAGLLNYYFLDSKRVDELHHRGHEGHVESTASRSPNEMIAGHKVQVQFVGANKDLTPAPFGKSPVYHNYFIGNDERKWASRAYGYSGMVYKNIYEGIDLKIYGHGQHVKYDLTVAPGSKPGAITLAYAGAELLALNEGKLVVKTSLGEIYEQKPVAYQIINGTKAYIKCEYVLRENQLSFSFPDNFDACYELVIDPLLIFSTYSGSTADNWGSTATPGENGNLYSAGVTTHLSAGGAFPATPGAFQTSYGGFYDIAIIKYDSLGKEMLYATYLGGNNSESPHSLVVNSAQELIVLGTTSSPNFTTTQQAFDRTFNGGASVIHVVEFTNGSDIFVARISNDGSRLLGSTFLGGSQNDGLNPPFGPLTRNYGDELRGDVITDDQNNIYLSTVTSSDDFPVVKGRDLSYNGGATDALLIKLKPDLSEIIWSTYIGGSGTDASHTLKLDRDNGIFLAGGTTSPDFPVKSTAYQSVHNGDADGWIAHIGSEGDTIYNATFTGTPNFDQVYFLDLNDDEEVFIYGQTSGSFPITPGVYSNPNSGQFVQKLDRTLSDLKFSTVFGSGRGVPDISPTAFLVNECNNLYMTGWGGVVNIQTLHWQSNTRGMPVTNDAYQSTTSGSDFYFIVLTDDASQFLYGTYMGGNLSTTHVDGGTSRFDKSGVVYQAVCAGCAAFNASGHSTSDFPTTAGAWSSLNRSGNCNNAAFKFDLSSLKARLQTNSVRLNMPGLSTVCMPDSIVFQNLSTGGEIFEWDLGDGTRIVKTDTSMIVHQYKSTGQYAVWLKAIDPGTCKVKDSVSTKVNVFVAQGKVQENDALCLGSTYQLKASGARSYFWRNEDNSFTSSEAMPIVSPEDTTRYFITMTEASGCVRQDTVDLFVIPLINPDFEIERSAECFNRPSVSVRNITDSLRVGDRLFFDFGDGQTNDSETVEHKFETDGLYKVKLVAVREFCVAEKVIDMPVFRMLIPNVITPKIKDDANDRLTIQLGDEAGLTPGDFGYKASISIYNRWGEPVFSSSDYQYDWDGSGLAGGIYYYEVSVDGHATCKSWVHLVK